MYWIGRSIIIVVIIPFCASLLIDYILHMFLIGYIKIFSILGM